MDRAIRMACSGTLLRQQACASAAAGGTLARFWPYARLQRSGRPLLRAEPARS
ncbi:hypothetical protein [Paenibacillus sp. tmac-D7]|uniref:hypothetical protein n=1 Tax=Paenibacillus sp. tmac-D7 TaxID=2591462 RepID=UPI0015E83DA3|nr:hypothetical protein [Paenibacillus sp. tmac-D7]